jgi:hypothetical protein
VVRHNDRRILDLLDEDISAQIEEILYAMSFLLERDFKLAVAAAFCRVKPNK